MKASFWHEKWKKGEIGFHESAVNPALTNHWHALSAAGGRVFVPLCGKSLDLAWLLSQGVHVIGVELSEIAVQELFVSLDMEPAVSDVENFKLYSAENIAIWVGDIFNLNKAWLGEITAIYDRAALVALPESMRLEYARKLIELSNCATQLLVTFEYDQSLHQGPPFSVPESAVQKCYGSRYQLECLESKAVAGRLKGRITAIESVWKLTRNINP
ncbi:thiopurine S-methyltransferase [Teredinibacter turnerae]|uniref:thiopurine S-methyltransferase n=1 Tax=Teredinibacter turnerae TaxID=2426 RepID=UPI0003615FCB|nr:thiopurine S-methyltransferase [Teredinibacter turnerae]